MKSNSPASSGSPETQAILNAHPAAPALFLHLADRDTNAKVTKTSTIENLFGVAREEATALLKKLAAAGCGEFVQKWHNKSHLKWDSSIKTRQFCEESYLVYLTSKEAK